MENVSLGKLERVPESSPQMTTKVFPCTERYKDIETGVFQIYNSKYKGTGHKKNEQEWANYRNKMNL